MPLDHAAHGFPPNPYNPHAWVIGDPVIGEDCWIGAFTVLDGSGGLTIGKGCDLSCGVQIYTHSTVRRVISERGFPDPERQPTRIGDHCHLGANAVVLMGCDIGDHTIVGAGAVVREGTVAPAWSVIVGVPGRVIPDAARRFCAPPASEAAAPSPSDSSESPPPGHARDGS